MYKCILYILFGVCLTGCSKTVEPSYEFESNSSLKLDQDIDTVVSEETSKFASPFRVNPYRFYANFTSLKARADSLLVYMARSDVNDREVRKLWERKFFAAFPNSYAEMDSLFGYEAPLAQISLENEGIIYNLFCCNQVIIHFTQLQTIPAEVFYRKYVNICINGRWQADNIRDGFDLDYKIYCDTKPVCNALRLYSDKQLLSVFRFIFDGPNPRNSRNLRTYVSLKNRFNEEDKRLASLVKKAYKQVTALHKRY